jgi:hypothetical protein
MPSLIGGSILGLGAGRVSATCQSTVGGADEREHQWPAETVLSKGDRLVGAFASLSEQSGSSVKRTTT